MDIDKVVLGNRPSAVSLARNMVVLLNSDAVARHLGHPGHMAPFASAGLRNTARHGLVVHANLGLARSLVPGVGIAPVSALVLVMELEPKAFVNTPGDEAGALALVVVPRVDTAAFALVGIIIGHGARHGAGGGLRRGAGAFVLDVAAGAGLDVVVGHVAAVGSLVPDAVSVDGGAFSLAGDGDVLVLFEGLDDGGAGVGLGPAVDGGAGDGIGFGEGAEREGIRGESDELHGEGDVEDVEVCLKGVEREVESLFGGWCVVDEMDHGADDNGDLYT